MKLLLLGAGGHAQVLLEMIQSYHLGSLIGIVDPQEHLWGQQKFGVPVLGGDDWIRSFSPNEIRLVNGIGSTDYVKLRTKVYETWTAQGYTFASIIHPKTTLAPSVKLGVGVQILAGTIINSNSIIGDNVLLNTGVVIEHDCHIANHCHLAPRSTLSGQVSIGEQVHVGVGATIIQSVSVRREALVAAGAVVTQNVKANVCVMGVPAREKIRVD